MTKRVYFFGDGRAEGDASLDALLGGKGAWLAEMTRLGVPVPPGFTLAMTAGAAGSAVEPALEGELDAALAKLEAATGATLGDAARPLLVSVRSGARVSMPGMLDTVLDVGCSRAVLDGLARRAGGDARFALDAYRRLVSSFAGVVLGVPRSAFEPATLEARRAAAVRLGVDATRLNAAELERRVPDARLDAAELEGLAAAFERVVLERTGAPFPSDPRAQLRAAIAAVVASAESPRAKAYRAMLGLPDGEGTACTVQAMVFGNLDDASGTGAVFTRDPSTGERRFVGEWLRNAQGDDVVAGVRTPAPVASGAGAGEAAGESLEAAMPEVFARLRAVGERLESVARDAQELEFTVQRGELFVLQTRAAKRAPAAAVRIAVELAREGVITRDEAVLRVEPSSLDPVLQPVLDPSVPQRVLAQGLPASPFAASGEVVFSSEEAVRVAATGRAVILVRAETSPEDVTGMQAAAGVLTARGGLTSHAAVVARAMSKSCVAGCSSVAVNARAGEMAVATGGDTETLRAGDVITLDGATGRVLAGAIATVPSAPTPEFAELVAWADGVRVARVRAVVRSAAEARTARSYGAEGLVLPDVELTGAELAGVLREAAGLPVAWLAGAATADARAQALLEATAAAAREGPAATPQIALEPSANANATEAEAEALGCEVVRPGRDFEICAPHRVPVAKLGAAQAALRAKP